MDLGYPETTLQSRRLSPFTHHHIQAMDTAIDLSDALKALDLANIRFQLM